MTLWRRLMNLLGVSPAKPSYPSAAVRQMDKDLDDQLRRALTRHKEMSEKVIKKSFDQVQRSADVQVVVRSLIDRIDREQDHVDKSYDLVRREHPPHDHS
jgi:ABC-type phosphate/phosphonate transport system substrate-binding protein